ncbi:MFS transporter [Rothia sp. CCM 9417]|uniref:MFS transporter n=1 Tax=unclassified Rothia (in: high G+C Gram-positive bacteria) TaxID=2689056 RepID=UPI003AE5C4BB
MKQTADPRRVTLYTWIISVGGFLFGYDTGIINGALPFLQQDFTLSPAAEGLATSALTLGAAFGALTAGQLIDRFGRRRILLVLAVVFAAGSLGLTSAPNLAVFIAFRVLVGLAVGAASAVVPIYLAEISPVNRRGAIVTRNQFMIVFGQLAAYVMNAVLGNLFAQNVMIWRVMFAISVVPALVLFLGMLLVPESPGYRKSTATARGVLGQLWQEPALRTTLLLACAIGIVQQATGVNALMYYGTQVLREAGFSTDAALTANISNGVLSVIGAAVGLWFVGRFPRRLVLTLGLAGTTVSLMLLALTSQFLDASARPWATLLISIIFLVFQQGAVSPVTWVLMSELFPGRVRGAGMGVATFVSWMANFCVSLFFPQMVAALGLGATFAVFAVIGVGLIAFTRRAVPETAGRTMD